LVDKRKLVTEIRSKLNQELSVVLKSAKAAHEAATHEESRAEDSHDTRGLEASYLAGAQAARVAELRQLILVYKFLPIFELDPMDQIGLGALIELEVFGKRSYYFLVHQGGGMCVQIDGKAVQLITPQSPLGAAIAGRRAGDCVEVEGREVVREYKIISIS